MVVQIVQGARGKEVSYAQAPAGAPSLGRARSTSGPETGDQYACSRRLDRPCPDDRAQLGGATRARDCRGASVSPPNPARAAPGVQRAGTRGAWGGAGEAVVWVEGLGPGTRRTFPPARGGSPEGHRSKAPLEYSRGSDKAWVFGALRVQDGHVLTQTNTAGYLELLRGIARANPTGD